MQYIIVMAVQADIFYPSKRYFHLILILTYLEVMGRGSEISGWKLLIFA